MLIRKDNTNEFLKSKRCCNDNDITPKEYLHQKDQKNISAKDKYVRSVTNI